MLNPHLTRPAPQSASMPSRHGAGGRLSLLSIDTFSVARVFLAVHVFLCHAFYSVHHWFGFCAVAGFFFISGYGMSVSGKRNLALLRLPRFVLLLAFFALIYYFVYGVLFYPTAWFLLSYFVAMFFYRFFGKSLLLFSVLYILYLVFLHYLDVDYVWVLSPFAFLIGFFVSKYSRFFTFTYSFILFLFSSYLFICFRSDFFFWGFFPLYVWFVLRLSSFSFFSFLRSYAKYTLPFFSLHCWVLGLFSATWTLGGCSSPLYALCSFCLSILFSFFLYRVPIFHKGPIDAYFQTKLSSS